MLFYVWDLFNEANSVVYLVSIMADEAVDNITRDLQERIRNADINLTNVSTIAKRGDEKVRILKLWAGGF